MKDDAMDVKLSVALVGRARNWKEAEKVIANILRLRGKQPREWDGDNTEEKGGAFCFSLSSR